MTKVSYRVISRKGNFDRETDRVHSKGEVKSVKESFPLSSSFFFSPPSYSLSSKFSKMFRSELPLVNERDVNILKLENTCAMISLGKAGQYTSEEERKSDFSLN